MSKKWFWADTRVEQLDIREIRGQQVDNAAKRDTKAWKRALKVREKGAGFKAKPMPGAGLGPDTSGSQRAGGSMLAASAMGSGLVDADDTTTSVTLQPQQVTGDGAGDDMAEDEDMLDADEEQVGTGRPTNIIDLAGSDSESSEESFEDEDAVADQLINELAGDVTLPQSSQASEKQRSMAIEL